jgi:hypothetical protein
MMTLRFARHVLRAAYTRVVVVVVEEDEEEELGGCSGCC